MLVAVVCTVAAFAEPSPEALEQQAAMKNLAEAIQAGDMMKLVDLLPASYVRDMNNIVRNFGEKMDEELWQKSRETAAILADAFAAQAENMMRMMQQGGLPGLSRGKPAPPRPPDPEKVTQVQEGFQTLAAFLRSDAMELKTLQKTDVTAVAAELTPIFSNLVASVDMKSFVSLSVDDTDVKMKKVNGKWVPADFAAKWNETTSDMLQGIQEMNFSSASAYSEKVQVMSMMDAMQPLLRQIGEAKTPDQFATQVGMMLIPLVMGRR